MRLGSWVQVLQSMCVWYRTTGASSPAWRHTSHHGPRLTHLRTASSGHARVHVLNHTGLDHIRMLGLGHWMARRRSGMLGNALMGRKWLGHHHRCAKKPSATRRLKDYSKRTDDHNCAIEGLPMDDATCVSSSQSR